MIIFSKGHQGLLNFDELSKAFVDNPQGFVKVLKYIQEDFIQNHMSIMDSLSENNLIDFLRIYHILRGNVLLHKIPRFFELMEKIRKHLELKPEEKQQIIKDEIHEEFNLIFQSLENKIKELEFN